MGSQRGGARQGVSERRRREEKRKRRNRAIAGLVGVLVVALIVVNVMRGKKAQSTLRTELTAGSCEVDQRTDAGADHVPDATYSVNPPAGGPHDPRAAGPGTFTPDQTVPADPNLVHSLEHGYVIVWYKPDLPTADIDRLVALGDKYDRDVLVVPRESSPVPVAATAWHQRLLCQQTEVDALDRFVVAYRNKGPEKIPH